MIDEFLAFLQTHPELIDEALRLLREQKAKDQSNTTTSSPLPSAASGRH